MKTLKFYIQYKKRSKLFESFIAFKLQQSMKISKNWNHFQGNCRAKPNDEKIEKKNCKNVYKPKLTDFRNVLTA